MFPWTMIKYAFTNDATKKLCLVALILFAGDRLLKDVNQKHHDVVDRVDRRVSAIEARVDEQHEDTKLALGEIRELVKTNERRVWDLYLDEKRQRRREEAARRVFEQRFTTQLYPRAATVAGTRGQSAAAAN